MSVINKSNRMKASWILFVLATLIVGILAFGAPGCGAGLGSGISLSINATKG